MNVFIFKDEDIPDISIEGDKEIFKDERSTWSRILKYAGYASVGVAYISGMV